MIGSIISDWSLEYPEPTDCFSPGEKYPEYPFLHISPRKNNVYSTVRRLFSQADLDLSHFNTRAWNPLGSYIARGDKVFVLCNFVYHKRLHETKNDFFAKCTHGSVIRALIDYIYIAAGPEGRIAFGNAPLQSCDFQKALKETGASVLPCFYKANRVNVTAKDLRLLANRRSVAGNILVSEYGDKRDAIIVSIDEGSRLNNLYAYGKDIRFRISDYNPETLFSFHRFNYHKYILHKDILDSDVIFSVPKLKTHEKVGLTAGLKGFVGAVAHKDCLVHHRFGPPKLKGDEYPDNGRVQILASIFHDYVQKRHYPRSLSPLFEILDKNLRRFLGKALGKIQAGAWYGNDTAWRMALDVADIIQYADKKGALQQTSQRKNLVLIDGIVAGEGNGPLSPRSISAKCLIFSDDIVLGDMIAIKSMGWDARNIPLINQAILKKDPRSFTGRDLRCIENGISLDLEAMRPILGRIFLPPKGWESYFYDN